MATLLPRAHPHARSVARGAAGATACVAATAQQSTATAAAVRPEPAPSKAAETAQEQPVAGQQPSGVGAVPPPQLAAAETTPAETEEEPARRGRLNSQPWLTRVHWLRRPSLPPVATEANVASAYSRGGLRQPPAAPTLRWISVGQRGHLNGKGMPPSLHTHDLPSQRRAGQIGIWRLANRRILGAADPATKNGYAVQRALRSCKSPITNRIIMIRCRSGVSTRTVTVRTRAQSGGASACPLLQLPFTKRKWQEELDFGRDPYVVQQDILAGNAVAGGNMLMQVTVASRGLLGA